ncbi:MAG: recombinase family protein [Chloroflexota bacterium]
MRAALYSRVSSKEQLEGYSIDAQKRAFRVLCQGRGWEPVAEYIDEGKSARTDKIGKRPAFRQAMADAQAHAFDVLVVHKIDRFSRNLRIALESFDVLGKAGVSFVSITEQMDFTTPYGKFALTMLGGLAQLYSDNLSFETRKGKGERKEQGLYNGPLPFGVMKGPDDLPKPHDELWVIRDEKGTIVRERTPVHEGLKLAFELAAQGKTDKSIAQVLNARGYRTWGTHGQNPFSKDTVGGVLQNRFYVGDLPDGKGGWVKGKHATIIPPELFEAAQQARARRRTVPQGTRSDAHRYSLSGIAHCAACGGHLRVFAKKRMLCNQRIERNGCSQPSARLSVLDSQMLAYFQAFKVPQDYREKMLAYCRGMDAEIGIETEIKSIKGVLNRIKNLYRIGDMEYAEYLTERQQLQARLARLTVTEDKPDHLGRAGQFLSNVALAWEAADQEDRNHLASELFEKVWLKDGVIQGVVPRPEMVPFFDLVYSEAVNDRLQVRPRRGTNP